MPFEGTHPEKWLKKICNLEMTTSENTHLIFFFCKKKAVWVGYVQINNFMGLVFANFLFFYKFIFFGLMRIIKLILFIYRQHNYYKLIISTMAIKIDQ